MTRGMAQLISSYLRVPDGRVEWATGRSTLTEKQAAVLSAAFSDMESSCSKPYSATLTTDDLLTGLLLFVVLDASRPLMIVGTLRGAEKVRGRLTELRNSWLIPAYFVIATKRQIEAGLAYAEDADIVVRYMPKGEKP